MSIARRTSSAKSRSTASRHLSRRHLLTGRRVDTQAGSAGDQADRGALRTPPPFLLKIFLRGGADGLTILAPYEDPDYQALRDETRLYGPGTAPGGDLEREALPLQGSGISGGPSVFGVPPALAPLVPIYDAGRLAFVHAVGNLDGVQSHFAAQDSTETGSNQLLGLPPDGWLARHLETKVDHGPPAFRAVSSGPLLKLSLSGTPAAAPIPDPANYSLPTPLDSEAGWTDELAAARLAALEGAFAAFGPPLEESLTGDVAGVRALEQLDFGAYQPAGGAVYPATDLAQALRQAAQIAKESDVEVFAVDSGGWDTHGKQGVSLDLSGTAAVPGAMYGRMDELAGALRAFDDDLAASTRPYLVLVVTEFGRKVPENSSAGTDHGKGGVALVLGTAVRGGRVYGSWPGIDPAALALNDDDLGVTTDVRALLWEVASRGLGNQAPVEVLFPGQSGDFPLLGLF